MLKEIYVLIGIAASGKSTYSEKLIKDRLIRDFEVPMPAEYTMPVKILNADTIRGELYGDPTIQGNGMEVFGVLFDQYIAALKDNITELIIIDNTSLTPKIRKRYYTLANTVPQMFNNTIKYNMVFFTPNLERSLEWNSKRDRHVPEDVIERQFNTYMGPSDKERNYANIVEISL